MSEAAGIAGDETPNETPAGGGSDGVGMDAIKTATLNGLDESYHEEWNNLSSRIQTPSDLAKSYVESQRMARQSIRMPGEGATDDDWNKVYNQLGRPAEAKDYKFSEVFGEGDSTYKATDEDKAFQQAFGQVAHRVGLTQRQVGALEAWQYENNQVQADAKIAKADQITDRYVKTLKEQYGPDYNAQKSNFGNSVRHYAGNDFDDLVGLRLEDGTFALDHPAFFRMFSKIGAERQEDFREPNAFNEGARNDAQAEHDRIRQEAINKGLLPSSPDWPTEELQRLSDRIHGTGATSAGNRSFSNL